MQLVAAVRFVIAWWAEATNRWRIINYVFWWSTAKYTNRIANVGYGNNSELVCRYVKLYDNMCKCKNINVNFIAKYAMYNVHGPLGRNYVQVYLNEGIEMENENARRKIRTKLFNNLVDDGDDDVMSATVHQIVELCAWRGERVYRPHDHNNFNEEEIEYLCTNWASWLYVYYFYFVRLKMFIYTPLLRNASMVGNVTAKLTV